MLSKKPPSLASLGMIIHFIGPGRGCVFRILDATDSRRTQVEYSPPKLPPFKEIFLKRAQ